MSDTNFPSDLGCVVCHHIFNGVRPVRLVVHEFDGSWGFYCGGVDHSQDETSQDFKWMRVAVLLERDKTVAVMAGLSRGEEAERIEVGKIWNISKI